jgi:hypothetical protein
MTPAILHGTVSPARISGAERKRERERESDLAEVEGARLGGDAVPAHTTTIIPSATDFWGTNRGGRVNRATVEMSLRYCLR